MTKQKARRAMWFFILWLAVIYGVAIIAIMRGGR